jgi:predicted MPP superfamily phosphohydrolase
MSSKDSARAAARRRFRVPLRIYARLGAYFGACWTMVGLLIHDVVPYDLAITVAVAVYTTAPLALFLRWGGWPFYPGAAFRLLVMRPFWYAQILLPLILITGAVGLIIGMAFGDALLGARWLAGLVAAVMIALFLAGYVGSRRLVIKELEVSIPRLPAAFEGTTIAHISDLHVGPQTSQRQLQRIRSTLRKLSPDIVAVNGDLVDDRVEDVAHYANALGGLSAPLGVFITPGNHEIYSGWDNVEREIVTRRLGTLLLNEARRLERDGDVIYIVGVGDPAGQRDAPRAAPDLERAFASIPSGATVIAFAHNPILWPAMAKGGASLTLSGHTHWGQFALPGLGWSLASPFLEHAMGVHQAGDALLYISPGTGYFGIPFRIGAPGEIVLVQLSRGAAGVRDNGLRRAISA